MACESTENTGEIPVIIEGVKVGLTLTELLVDSAFRYALPAGGVLHVETTHKTCKSMYLVPPIQKCTNTNTHDPLWHTNPLMLTFALSTPNLRRSYIEDARRRT